MGNEALEDVADVELERWQTAVRRQWLYGEVHELDGWMHAPFLSPDGHPIILELRGPILHQVHECVPPTPQPHPWMVRAALVEPGVHYAPWVGASAPWEPHDFYIKLVGVDEQQRVLADVDVPMQEMSDEGRTRQFRAAAEARRKLERFMALIEQLRTVSDDGVQPIVEALRDLSEGPLDVQFVGSSHADPSEDEEGEGEWKR